MVAQFKTPLDNFDMVTVNEQFYQTVVTEEKT